METKIRFQPPDLCAYANFFAKGHAHWGEKKNQLQRHKNSEI